MRRHVGGRGVLGIELDPLEAIAEFALVGGEELVRHESVATEAQADHRQIFFFEAVPRAGDFRDRGIDAALAALAYRKRQRWLRQNRRHHRRRWRALVAPGCAANPRWDLSGPAPTR